MSRLFASHGQSIGASTSASVLPMNIQGLSPLGLTGLISLSPGTLKSLLQHHNLKGSILQCSAFFMVQLSNPYLTSGKTIALTIWTFAAKQCLCFLICVNLTSQIRKHREIKRGTHSLRTIHVPTRIHIQQSSCKVHTPHSPPS